MTLGNCFLRKQNGAKTHFKPSAARSSTSEWDYTRVFNYIAFDWPIYQSTLSPHVHKARNNKIIFAHVHSSSWWIFSEHKALCAKTLFTRDCPLSQLARADTFISKQPPLTETHAKIIIKNESVYAKNCFLSGVGLRPLHLSPDTILLVSYPGELFMRLLKLMILPLVIASLIAGEYTFIIYPANNLTYSYTGAKNYTWIFCEPLSIYKKTKLCVLISHPITREGFQNRIHTLRESWITTDPDLFLTMRPHEPFVNLSDQHTQDAFNGIAEEREKI